MRNQYNSYDALNFNLIKSLDALLIEKNVSKAAERCDVVQSAMSVSLKKLRAHFNNELLVKGKHNLYELTPFAEKLIPQVRIALQEMNNLFLNKPTFDPCTAKAKVYIGMSDYVGFVLLPILMKFLEENAPNIQVIQVALNDVNDMAIYHALNLDFAIGDFRSPPLELKTSSLFSDSGIIVGDQEHPIFVKKILTLDDILEYPQVFVSLEKTRDENFILEMMKSEGFEVDVGLITPHTLLALQVLPGTNLLTNTVKKLAFPFIEPLKLAYREVPYTLRKYEARLYWSQQYDKSPLHQWLRQSIKDLLTQSSI